MKSRSTGILAGNYGEAGAINLYGPAYGLPEAISGSNTYWLRGYGDPPPETLIVVGYPLSAGQFYFKSCKVAGEITNRYQVWNEEFTAHPTALLCHTSKRPWDDFWKDLPRNFNNTVPERSPMQPPPPATPVISPAPGLALLRGEQDAERQLDSHPVTPTLWIRTKVVCQVLLPAGAIRQSPRPQGAILPMKMQPPPFKLLLLLTLVFSGACTATGPARLEGTSTAIAAPASSQPNSPTPQVTSSPNPTPTNEISTSHPICASVTEIPNRECAALVAFYIHTDGKNWIMNNEEWVGKDNWLTSATPCSWAGVACEDGHITEILLGLNGLAGELPPEIGDLTRLSRLDLTDNQLTNVPAEIGSLTGLTELNLGFNDLSSLPAEISQLTNLTSLSLAGNRLTSLPDISKLTNLTGLNLAENDLSDVPIGIGNLTKLNGLSLTANKLSRLPPEIGELTNLTGLYLDGNDFRSLPPEIGQLVNLNWLYLMDNDLDSLPPEIGELTNLMEFYLEDNHLTSLPPEIGKLINLDWLMLTNNDLLSLPPEIGNLVNLTILYLSGNDLSDLPPEIGNLTNLTVLSLSDNNLSDLPAEIANLTNLTELWVDGNQITSLPPELCANLSGKVFPASVCAP